MTFPMRELAQQNDETETRTELPVLKFRRAPRIEVGVTRPVQPDSRRSAVEGAEQMEQCALPAPDARRSHELAPGRSRRSTLTPSPPTSQYSRLRDPASSVPDRVTDDAQASDRAYSCSKARDVRRVERAAGEFVAIVGASEREEHTAPFARRPSTARPAGTSGWTGPLRDLDARGTAELRTGSSGSCFVHHLLREFSALENVMMPLLIGARRAQGSLPRGRGAVRGRLGRTHEHRPPSCRGRAATLCRGRALVHDRRVMADEPSGNSTMRMPTAE